MILIANIVDSENRQMDELLKATIESRESADVQLDEEGLARQNAEEQADLLKVLEAERAEVLGAISEETSNADADFDVVSVGLSSIAFARRAIRLRIVAMEMRLDYTNAALEFDEVILHAETSGALPSESDEAKYTSTIDALRESWQSKCASILDEESTIPQDIDEELEKSLLVETINESIADLKINLGDLIGRRTALCERFTECRQSASDEFSLTLDSDQRDSIIANSVSEAEKYRIFNQTLNESDEKIFDMEESYILDILNDLTIWKDCNDFRAMQNSLHNRYSACKYFELDISKRCHTIEEEFERETRLLTASIGLISSSAGRADIEKEFYNINRNAKESAAASLRDIEKRELDAIDLEKSRHADLPIDFDRHYVTIVETNCARHAMIRCKVLRSRRKVWSGIQNVLNEKKRVFAASLEAQKQPYILQSYLMKQIENEIFREDFEMQAVYVDLVCFNIICF